MNVASSYGITLGSNKERGMEMISVVLAKERAQAMLAETRARKERELENEEEKKKLMLVQLEGQEGMIHDSEKENLSDLEGDMSQCSDDDSVGHLRPRITMRKMRRGVLEKLK
jgi:hypothetical protein